MGDGAVDEKIGPDLIEKTNEEIKKILQKNYPKREKRYSMM